MLGKNGIVEEDGALYYYAQGERYNAGMIYMNGSYYYVRTSGQLATGKYYAWNNNGLMPEGTYNFDSTGRMI